MNKLISKKLDKRIGRNVNKLFPTKLAVQDKLISKMAFPKKKKQLPIATYTGKDFWGRDTYKLENSLQHLRMVDGVLHTSTISGEPSSPVKTKLKLIKKKTFGRCKKCGVLISEENTILKNVSSDALAKGKISYCDRCYYFD